MEGLEYFEAAKNVVSSTKTVFETIKSVRELISHKTVDDGAVKERMTELLEKVLELQQAQFIFTQQNQLLADEASSMRDKISKLEKEIARRDAFDHEAQNYELQTVGPDAQAYALKKSANTDEPGHYLCPSCYSQAKKSILQLARYEQNTNVLRCNECGTEIHKRVEGRDTVMMVPVKNKWDGYI